VTVPESIASLAGAIRSGERTATAVVADTLRRAADSQAALNAFIRLATKGALVRAAAIDAAIERGEDPGPLAGVPIALKDLIDEADTPNTSGSAFPPIVPDRSAEVVQRLEAAGAVIVGRTGLHEFAFGFSSENEHFGPVRNPWDTDLSPGGSSGGSAAAVAAGIVPAAIGTDTGGSVRVPAALCGVVGLKVTHGRVPLTGVVPLASSLDTVGPLARTVADTAVVYAAIAGADSADPWSAPRAVDRLGPPTDPTTLRVAVPKQWVDGPLTAEMDATFRAVLERIASGGAVVEEVDEPAFESTAASDRGASVEIAAVHRKRWDTDPDRYGRQVAARLEHAFAVDADDLVAALEWRAGARNAAARLFERYDVLVTPTVGATAKTIGVDDIDVDGTPVFYRKLLAHYTAPVNHVGLPALALPIPDTGIPPASLQIVGPAWGETGLLETGMALETAGVVGARVPPNWHGLR
jgi:Asp-tRNA(Asn)/Glu-tRNA(Gln) amidotransferase A subunit family amidase